VAALEGLAVARALTAPDELSRRKSAWKHAFELTPHGKPVELAASGEA